MSENTAPAACSEAASRARVLAAKAEAALDAKQTAAYAEGRKDEREAHNDMVIRAIELQQVVDEIIEDGHMYTHHLAQLRAASDRLDAAMAGSRPVPTGWIGIDECAPEPGQTVLGFYPGTPAGGWSFATVTYRSEDGPCEWSNPEDDEDSFVEPSHWMPLPAAPKGGKA